MPPTVPLKICFPTPRDEIPIPGTPLAPIFLKQRNRYRYGQHMTIEGWDLRRVPRASHTYVYVYGTYRTMFMYTSKHFDVALI